MPVRKRNEYLDTAESDDDASQHTDTEAASSKIAALAQRSFKRRKLTSASDSDDESDFESGIDIATTSSQAVAPTKVSAVVPTTTTTVSGPTTTPAQSSSRGKKFDTIKAKTKTSKPGVIYLSRIPPFMRPSTVRSHLSLHGEITKLFLTPEPPFHYLSRRRAGGNKKHSYVDGWVEFKRKKDAKICVDAINGHIVGGKKGGWYRDDVWNAKYLRGFSWGDLMGSVQTEEREREERVRVGVGREGRERREFIRNLERSKVEETRRSKREKKKEREGVDERVDLERVSGRKAKEEEKAGDRNSVDSKRTGFERRFRQNEVKGKTNKGSEQPDEVQRVLSKIF
jgi:ESF2/ABP1 family protein